MMFTISSSHSFANGQAVIVGTTWQNAWSQAAVDMAETDAGHDDTAQDHAVNELDILSARRSIVGDTDHGDHTITVETGETFTCTWCTCDPIEGPCPLHGELLIVREGATLRTARELVIRFIDDALTFDDSILSATGRIDLERARRADPLDGDIDDMLNHLSRQVEDYGLGDDIFVNWEDGYTITRVTGPLLEM